jgi:acetyl-CoA acetyltransferase
MTRNVFVAGVGMIPFRKPGTSDAYDVMGAGAVLSKGHPLGATGLAQRYELTHRLRGTAEQRQVEGAKVALAHNLGLGGACVTTVYKAA